MSRPFEGSTVVEFGQFVVVPFCAQLPADAGARVIKVALLMSAEVPVATVRHVDELLFDPHAAEEGLIADYGHPTAGTYRGLGAPIRMSSTPLRAERPSPLFAAHTSAALSDIGFDPTAIETLRAEGAVVDGRAAEPPDPTTRSR